MRLRIVTAVLFLPLAAVAQDMPLFTFSNPADGWVKVEGKPPAIAEVKRSQNEIEVESAFTIAGTAYTVTHFSEVPVVRSPVDKFYDYRKLKSPQSREVLAFVRTPDGGTVYVGFHHETAVWAFTPDKDGKLTNGAPYAPLRLRKGYDNDKQAREKQAANPPRTAVRALALDPAGRLYSATDEDLQAFDPTGRLCGSLPRPDKGKVDAMAWEKESLAVWVSGQKWKRAMKAD